MTKFGPAVTVVSPREATTLQQGDRRSSSRSTPLRGPGDTVPRAVKQGAAAEELHVDPIPESMTVDEAAEFWDTHSVADYRSEVIEFRFEPEGSKSYVAIDGELLARLEGRARERGVSVETLVNLWLSEKLTA
jgi:hypothetical protein